MKLISCRHPVKVLVNGRYQYVPCGKCDVCLERRSDVWVRRLLDEAHNWQYQLFFTLSYNEASVPRLDYVSSIDSFVSDDGRISRLSDYSPTSRDYAFINRRLHDFGSLFVLRKYDLQKFIKRLRIYNVRKLASNETETSLRYYAVGEYGTRTSRPHYHGIIFTNCHALARSFSQVVASLWPYGNISCKPCTSSHYGYVARYVNSFSGSKSSVFCLFRGRGQFSPFSIKSQNLGIIHKDAQDLRELFHTGVASRQVYCQVSRCLMDISNSSQVESRLFPAVRDFDKLSGTHRNLLYASYRTLGSTDFDSYKSSAGWLVGRFFGSKEQRGARPPQFLTSEEVKEISGQKELASLLLPFVANKKSLLYHLYLCSSRVCSNAELFGVDIPYYVSRIDLYRSNKKLLQLKKFYEFQDERFNSSASSMEDDLLFDTLYLDDFNRLDDIASQFIPLQNYLQNLSYRSKHSSCGRDQMDDAYLQLHPNLIY